MRTVEEVQAGLIERLKADTALVALLGSSDRIKETEWQGADFVFPAVRVENDVLPSIDGCSPDNVEIVITVLSETKTSKQCSLISAEISRLFHCKTFKSVAGVSYLSVKVTRVPYPKQQEGQSIWQSPIQISAQVK
jgi:hypothetical protein